MPHAKNFSFTDDQSRHFTQALVNQGMRRCTMNEVIADPDRAAAAVHALGGHEPERLVHHRFHRLSDKLRVVQLWNDVYELGFVKEDFDKIAEQIKHVAWPNNDFLTTAVIIPRLPDGPDGRPGYLRTFDFLSEVILKKYSLDWQDFSVARKQTTVDRVRLRDDVVYEPGLFVEVIDLAFGWDRYNERRNKLDVHYNGYVPAHDGVLAAAAMDEEWVRQIDHQEVPETVMMGYQVSTPTDSPWVHTLSVSYDEVYSKKQSQKVGRVNLASIRNGQQIGSRAFGRVIG